MMREIPIFFLVTFAVVLLNSVSLADDTLTPQQPLLDSHGTTLLDAGNRFELGFFTPNDSSYRYVGIWFYNISPRTVVWVANRRSPLPDLSGRLSLTTNGTLLLTSDNSTMVFWSSRDGSAPLRNPVARLLDNGNFVVGEEAEPNGYVAWQSYDHPTDTILPGMRFGRNMTSGLNLNLTAWTSLSDPTPGDYVVGINMDGVPEEILWQRRIPLWRSGPWNGLYLSGGPEMVAENLVQYHFTVASQQFIYTYTIRDNSLPARITLIPSGELRVLIWVVYNQEWSVRGYSPRDPCDFLSACGLNAICIPNRSPMCNCLTGFKPKNSTNWNILRDWSGGCVRNTELDCRNRTDGFFNQSNLKLPETSSAVMRASLTLAECSNLCLNDCNCTAYASANVNGSGCILWTSHLTDIRFFFGGMGQDLYVRLAAADLIAAYAESRPSNKRRVGVIVAVTLAASFLLSCAAFCIWRWKTKKSFVGEETEEQDLDLPLFDLDTIVNATGNFSTGNKLGEGGFGPVYKGRLSEGQEIAVKRLSKTSSQGVNEFKNEVQLIAKLQHRSLVRLLGCCVEAGERMLIYEYLSNGSLDKFLFDMLLWSATLQTCSATLVFRTAADLPCSSALQTWPVAQLCCVTETSPCWQPEIISSGHFDSKLNLNSVPAHTDLVILLCRPGLPFCRPSHSALQTWSSFLQTWSFCSADLTCCFGLSLCRSVLLLWSVALQTCPATLVFHTVALVCCSALPLCRPALPFWSAALQTCPALLLCRVGLSLWSAALQTCSTALQTYSTALQTCPVAQLCCVTETSPCWQPEIICSGHFNNEVKSGQLDWKLRYNIIVGIARGLLYLHHDSRFIIIHRDLKASNILLDQDMNPKISDFGMARILDGDENAAKTKRIVGTYGYMPPEYIKNGRFSIKSDIFSFGILILEIISGKRNTEVFTSDQHLNLLDYVWRLWRNDKALELIDETICPPFSMEEVMRCINIGLLCVQERCEDRPIVTSILLMLLGSDNTSLPEPRQPGFVSRDLHEGNSSSIMKYTCSNQVSVTILEAR
ncbi:hypothetical protein ZIOFF_019119 [Zingiber officinale]|uniref:non-specific serine/threonine protein kinase n=1 Tax=Zingiber officinale TaxID=94328 RepID=A0A8J5LSN3_ZINOF|nr:hypothetical protein ZIOFF_019119 [Zingiber officinale]